MFQESCPVVQHDSSTGELYIDSIYVSVSMECKLEIEVKNNNTTANKQFLKAINAK